MLAGLDCGADRVALAAADVGFVPLSAEFIPVYAGDALAVGLETLDRRPPLGALDLGAALREAVGWFERSSNRGTGVSPVRETSLPRRERLLDGAYAEMDATKKEVLQELARSPKTPEHAERRRALYQKLAELSPGLEAYRVLSSGIVEFEHQGPHAEALAREFSARVARETGLKVLDGTLECAPDAGFRAQIHGRQAELETGADRRAELLRRAYWEAEENLSCLVRLVDVLAGAGREKEAIELLERSLRKGASAPWMHERLAGLYHRDGPGEKSETFRVKLERVHEEKVVLRFDLPVPK